MMNSTVNTDIEIRETESGLNPTKFVLWLLIVASVMLFAAFTSAYIVRRGEGNWLIFDLPQMFAFSTGIIALSSFTMQFAYSSAKKDETGRMKMLLYVTLVLGILFAIFQIIGWSQLVSNNVHMVGNPSESFVYVLSGLHLFHMIAGIGFIIAMIIKSAQFKIRKNSLLYLNLCTTLWHFLGGMWIYLYFFLLLNR